ncbi:MAG TPA: septum formation initiator family protein [Verrucomicrobiae bacterium]|nr:septum formation initiator family protein [Verrucomicrobiae bacterium]
MARNQNSQAAVIRFGPALAALFACFVIAGAAVGYVWQKGQIYQLGRQIREKELRLNQLSDENDQLSRQLADLRSPVMLDQRARQLNLGLAPAQPTQMVWLPEPSVVPENNNATHQFAQRPTDVMTP